MALRSIHTALTAYEQEKNEPPKTFQEMGYAPEGTHRYAYFFGADAIQPNQPGAGPYAVPPNLEARLREAGVTDAPRVIAVGNIDYDATLDVWVLTSDGQPVNVVNDLTE
jgi:hypothetical protein